MHSVWENVVDNWTDNYGNDLIEWKTSPGIGDWMYGMNIAYMRAFVNQKPTHLKLHWYFDRKYQYHYEDPEPYMERFDYIHQHYRWKDMVQVEHIHESQMFDVYKQKYKGVTRRRYSEMYRYWMFDNEVPTINKKIVIWRQTNNLVQQLHNHKQSLLGHEWDRLVYFLESMGYTVFEIDYRTPIREAFYHIRTAECCISYEGMWHYVAKNFFKPHIVLNGGSITKWHTPAAVNVTNFYIDKDIHKLEDMMCQASMRASTWKKTINKFMLGK